eukprot:SAG31_NODE_4050_length_3637_cov_1.854155_3_plen_156_part_00
MQRARRLIGTVMFSLSCCIGVAPIHRRPLPALPVRSEPCDGVAAPKCRGVGRGWYIVDRAGAVFRGYSPVLGSATHNTSGRCGALQACAGPQLTSAMPTGCCLRPRVLSRALRARTRPPARQQARAVLRGGSTARYGTQYYSCIINSVVLGGKFT